jgi:hypothetical protein
VHYGKAASSLPTAYTDAEGGARVAWYCSQVVVESTCSVSRDGGITFPQSRPVYTFKGDLFTDAADRRLRGPARPPQHLAVDGTGLPAELRLQQPGRPRDQPPLGRRLPDEGLSWTIRQIPDATSPNFDADPPVDVDGGDRAYVAYEDATSNVRVATTTDRGATWTPSQDLGAPYGIDNATMPTVIAGSAGRAAGGLLRHRGRGAARRRGQPENQLFAFDPDGDDPQAGWHLYVSMTYDGGATWTTTDVTPTDPVQRGCIWWGSAQGTGEDTPVCANNKRNLLDFIDIAVDEQGRVLVGWADGCVNRCVTEGHTRQSNTAFADRPAEDMALTRQEFDELYSQEDIGVITRQSCGLGLIAEFDAGLRGPGETCAGRGGRRAVRHARRQRGGVIAAPGPGTAAGGTGTRIRAPRATGTSDGALAIAACCCWAARPTPAVAPAGRTETTDPGDPRRT